ncbi:YfcC family protein [Peribacillus frigoritolerans]|uniref:YfcC family protein n=1 Tax=Peribacillus frigoritolerans TaxID=450367 RepID=UPI000FD764C8|nr:Na+/H+ antiporter NhaC family protein [Peribacillus frigoritolerans]AZV59460.1 YfcC family protein [Peribacillus frigoritolerans]
MKNNLAAVEHEKQREPEQPGDNRINRFSKLKMPNIFVILFVILILCAVATYIVPSGQYDLSEDGIIVPNSYAQIDKSPASLMDVFRSLHIGMVDSSAIIFGLLFTGGAFAVIEATGAINGAISEVVRKGGTKKYYLLSIVMIIFGVTAVVGVITSEVIAFIPIGLLVARALRLDSVTGLAITIVPSSIGFATCFINPSSLALAQHIAGLPMFSGKEFRAILFVFFMLMTMIYILSYARKISKNPEARLIKNDPLFISDSLQVKETEFSPFDWKHKLVLLSFVGVFIFYVVGTSLYQWGIAEMAACFVIIALLAAVIFKMNSDTFIDHFVSGMKNLVFAALIIGIARSIMIILQDGNVLDTAVYILNNIMEPLPKFIGAIAIYVMSSAIHFFVGSGTGQAALTIPIIAPLTDLLGLTRQLGILCFQIGDGLTNILFPTSSILMAGLAIAKIPYGKWLKFIIPYFLMAYLLGAIGIIVGVLIGYQ